MSYCDTCAKSDTCMMRSKRVMGCTQHEEKPMTRYQKMFGTPEQVAQTLNKLLPRNMHCEYCSFYDYCHGGDCLIGNRDVLLKWLKGSAE